MALRSLSNQQTPLCMVLIPAGRIPVPEMRKQSGKKGRMRSGQALLSLFTREKSFFHSPDGPLNTY